MAADQYNYGRSRVTYDRKGRFGGARFQTWDIVHTNSTRDDSDGLGDSSFPNDKYSDHVLLSSKEQPAAKPSRMGFPEGMFQHYNDINRNDYNSYQNGDGKSTNDWTTKLGNGYATEHAAQEYLTMKCKPSAQPSDGGWKTSKAHGTPVSRATNDIGTAVNYLRETARPPAATVSTAGANRWKSGMPAMIEHSYSSSGTTIDSSEAAKKYNGYFI